MPKSYDHIIIGTGIVGLSIARVIRRQKPDANILLIEKEFDAAQHSSGRNSGVLHAGFYYTADSLKARFTVTGNRALKEYCQSKGIAVNSCGKLVVAQNQSELAALHELHDRGRRNGSNVALISAEQALRVEPNVQTFKEALFSPDTATVDPLEVCLSLKNDLLKASVEFRFNCRYLKKTPNGIMTTQGEFRTRRIINCAGLYADKIAHDFGFSKTYTIIPFKGLYLKYTKNTTDVSINIYPVPNLNNPFLGVHFTKTVDGHIKIGPTAIPAFWRENYTSNLKNFNLSESLSILTEEARLFLANSFHFRDLAFEEIHKYSKKYFIGLAQKMVKSIDPDGFTDYTEPGIRAQLLNLKTRELVQDFVIEGDEHSIHVLNAVSPAFTCAFPFAEFVYQSFIH